VRREREHKNRNKHYPTVDIQTKCEQRVEEYYGEKKNHNNLLCMMKQYNEKNMKRKVKRFFSQSGGLPVYEDY
jgi:hypothetical protein